MSPELSRALARWVAARDAVQGFTSRVTLDTAYEMRQAEAELDRLARAPPQGERAPDLDPDTIASFWAKGLYDHLTRCRDAGDETGCAGVIAAIEEWRRLTIQLNARRALAAYSPQDNAEKET